jgi:hypothetical protein
MKSRIAAGLLLMGSVVGVLLAAEAPKGTPKVAPKKTAAVALPVHFEGDRFWVEPVLPKGQTLKFFTDTEGALEILEASVKRTELPKKSVGEGMGRIDFIQMPAFKPEASVPPPLGNDGNIMITIPVTRPGDPTEPADGTLGQAWFSGRVWTLDYLGKRMLWYPEGGLPAGDPAHRVPLGFKKDESGKRPADFARITVTIDGEPLDLVLDTGATVRLTDAALKALGDGGPSSRATSFIGQSHFDRWRQKHPDWRVIENADASLNDEPMIEVPAVTVAGHTVGPVWFTRRPDPNYQQFLSFWTDRQVQGALGGSALKYFRVSLDYPNAVALFERP